MGPRYDIMGTTDKQVYPPSYTQRFFNCQPNKRPRSLSAEKGRVSTKTSAYLGG